MVETYYHSIVDIISLSEKNSSRYSNAFVKDWKKAAHDVKETIWKANQINYYEVSITYLYLINWFNLVQKQNSLTKS